MNNILYEDRYILIINKHNGIAVHGGSRIFFGLIEILRLFIYKINYIELVHRIDKDCSGILLLAKKSSTLKHLHKQLLDKSIKKEYLVIVHGYWEKKNTIINFPIYKNKKTTFVDCNKGKIAITYVTVIKYFKKYTLLKINILTGKRHQIRVHLSYLGHPIVFDKKYGNLNLDRTFFKKNKGYNGNFILLHSYSLIFFHHKIKKKMKIIAPLFSKFKISLKSLEPL